MIGCEVVGIVQTNCKTSEVYGLTLRNISQVLKRRGRDIWSLVLNAKIYSMKTTLQIYARCRHPSGNALRRARCAGIPFVKSWILVVVLLVCERSPSLSCSSRSLQIRFRRASWEFPALWSLINRPLAFRETIGGLFEGHLSLANLEQGI